ncbi:MAG: flavodoxin-dependent (E)-4-hydroxy-3-methylbut-2-enyl-diphosphate synthase [candidate division Zixibacteria bacterium]|nr:flavodoxin-dependent (E)-4-hydroxy-3-methylbut-2-enyl-diphosphate synthase [candidate division Zixibacteria bacterium]
MIRRKSREVKIGAIAIGGDQPIAVQSMCSTKTDDIIGTLEQIGRMVKAGVDIVRVAVPNREAALALPEIVADCAVPLVADIHFDYRLALAAADSGVAKLRLNPGNIGDEEKIRQVIDKAKDKAIPIRIGVNQGSVERDLVDKYIGPRPEAMVESAMRHIDILQRNDFHDIVISLKASSVWDTIEAYRLIADKCDYPLHLGVTEAGPAFRGSIKSAVAIGILLYEGIGDTIRVSLTADVSNEIKAAWEILRSLGLRYHGPDLISCPTCGRTEIDLIPLVTKVEKALGGIDKPIKVAVMGCVVNGPGEAAEADIGVIGGKGSLVITRKGRKIRKVPEAEIEQALIEEIEKFKG